MASSDLPGFQDFIVNNAISDEGTFDVDQYFPRSSNSMVEESEGGGLVKIIIIVTCAIIIVILVTLLFLLSKKLRRLNNSLEKASVMIRNKESKIRQTQTE